MSQDVDQARFLETGAPLQRGKAGSNGAPLRRGEAGIEQSHVRERIQKAEQGHSLRPGALCPHCCGHAFKRAELKAGTPCPSCGKSPRVAA